MVDPAGYATKTFEEIRSEVVTRFKERFGPSVDTASETNVGLLIDIITASARAADERAAEAAAAGEVLQAAGEQLDRLLAPLFNSQRSPAVGSTGTLIVWGESGTTILASEESPARASNDTGGTYQFTQSVELGFTVWLVFRFGPASELSATSCTIDGTTFGPTIPITGTGAEMAQNMSDVMPAFSTPEYARKLPVYEDSNGDGILAFELQSITNATVTATASDADAFRGEPVFVTSEEPGAVPGDAMSITSIETPQSGWLGAFNPDDVVLGKLEDTDAEYLARHLNTIGAQGRRSELTLRSQLLDPRVVPGVEFVRIYQNKTGVTDALGIPPYAFEAVVYGGEDAVIAQTILEQENYGTPTYGSTTVFIEDERFAGEQVVSFSGAAERYMWAKITITMGEGFPSQPLSDIQAAVQQSLTTWGNFLGIGRDVYIDEVRQNVNVQGTSSIGVEMASTSNATDPKPALAAANFTISARQISRWNEGRIEVSILS